MAVARALLRSATIFFGVVGKGLGLSHQIEGFHHRRGSPSARTFRPSSWPKESMKISLLMLLRVSESIRTCQRPRIAGEGNLLIVEELPEVLHHGVINREVLGHLVVDRVVLREVEERVMLQQLSWK